MDKKALVRIINKIVENRLNKIIESDSFDKKLNEVISRQLLNLIVENKKTTNKKTRLNLESVKTNTKKQITKNKKFTNNSIINKILNETKSDIPPDHSINDTYESEYDGGGNAFSDIINNELDTINTNPIENNKVIINEKTGKPLPDFLSKALTKNYSSDLKKIDEKAQKYRNGAAMINMPSGV